MTRNQNEEAPAYYEVSRAMARSEVQAFLRKLAIASSDPTGRGILSLYECVSMLRAQVGEEPLKKEWKEAYSEKTKNLDGLRTKVSNLNFFLFQLDEFKVKQEQEVTSPSFIRYRKMYAEVVSEIDLLYDAFHILLEATKVLKFLSIPNEYWIQKPTERMRP